jgi:long-subunit fatty acid transport protein
LKTTSNFRLGGELRLNKLYLRSGFSYYGKAIKPGQDNASLNYNLISFGTGYRERNISIDFAYTFYNYSQSNVLYPLNTGPDPASVDYNLKTDKNLFTLTLGYKFGY